MQNIDASRAANAWLVLAGNVFVPNTEEEYNRLVIQLDCLIDIVGEDQSHPLASIMEVLGVLIEKYEAEHVPEIKDESEELDAWNFESVLAQLMPTQQPSNLTYIAEFVSRKPQAQDVMSEQLNPLDRLAAGR